MRQTKNAFLDITPEFFNSGAPVFSSAFSTGSVGFDRLKNVSRPGENQVKKGCFEEK
jgi:hypothetical protein